MRRTRGRSPRRSSRSGNDRIPKNPSRRRSPPRSSGRGRGRNSSRNITTASSRAKRPAVKRSRNDDRRDLKRRKTEPSKREYESWAKNLSSTELLALLRTHAHWLTQYQADIISMEAAARKSQLVRTVADEFYAKRLPIFDKKEISKMVNDGLAADWCYARTPVELLCVLKYLKPDHKLIQVPIRDAGTLNIEDLQKEVYETTPKDTLPSKGQLEEVVKIIQDQESGAGLGGLKIPKKARSLDSKRSTGGRGSKKRTTTSREDHRSGRGRGDHRSGRDHPASSRRPSSSSSKVSSKPRGHLPSSSSRKRSPPRARVSGKTSSTHIRADRAPRRDPPPRGPRVVDRRPAPPTRPPTVPSTGPRRSHLPLSPRTMAPSSQRTKKPVKPSLYHQTNTNSRQPDLLQFRSAPSKPQEPRYPAYRPPTFPKPPTRSPGNVLIGVRPIRSPVVQSQPSSRRPINNLASRSQPSSSRKRGSEFYPSLPSFPQTEVVDEVFPPIHQARHDSFRPSATQPPRVRQLPPPEPKTFFPPPPQRRSLYHETARKPVHPTGTSAHHPPAIRPGANFHRMDRHQPPQQAPSRYSNPFYPSVSMTMRAD